MTTIDVNAQLLVDDGSGTRVLSVNDLGVSETGGASEITLAALQAASHADLVDIVTALATILTKLGTTLSTEGRTVARTDFTYDGDENMTGYTEAGVVWTIVRNPDGTISDVVPA